MSNLNFNLANKVFTYVKHGVDITDSMKSIYNNSLILIGDQKQIYVPVLNAYVGIGEERFKRIEDMVTADIADHISYGLTINQENNVNTADFTYAITGMNTVPSSTGHKISYTLLGVPTKKYVDDKIEASTLIIDNTGTSNVNGNTVITNAYLSAAGKFSYTYSSVSSVASGEFNYEQQDTKTQLSDINAPDAVKRGIDVITGVNIVTDKLKTTLSYTYTSIYSSQDHHSTEIEHKTNVSNSLITNVHLSESGQLSYTSTSLQNSKSQPNGFLYGFTQDALGNVSMSGRDFANDIVKGEIHKVAVTETDAHRYVSYAYIDSLGKFHASYSYFWLNPQDDFKWHELNVAQQAPSNTQDFVYVLYGLTTSNQGLAEAHTISYALTGVPTKKYVDNRLQANDAMRYCGTVTPAASANGNITLTHHDNASPSHGTVPDTSKGALYKVSAIGYIGYERVAPGDVILSYTDNASTNTATGWDVLNSNLDLRTATPTKNLSSLDASYVLTNVYLDSTGTLSYTYSGLTVKTNAPTLYNTTGIRTKPTLAENYDIKGTDSSKGFPVITAVSLTQNGLETQISYAYTYIYASVHHHSLGTVSNTGNQIKLTYETPTNIITGATISSDGVLSYSYSPFIVQTAYSSTYSTYAVYASGIEKIKTTDTNTTGVISDIFVDDDKVINVTYTNLAYASSGSAGFIKSLTQSVYGKVDVVTGSFTTQKTTNSITLSEGSQEFVTSVNLDNTGKLTYTLTNVSVTDSNVLNVDVATNAGTTIYITGTTGDHNSRTPAYMAQRYFYTYINGTNNTYMFLQSAEVARSVNANVNVTAGQNISAGANISATGNITGSGNLTITGNSTLGTSISTNVINGKTNVNGIFTTSTATYLGSTGNAGGTYTYNLTVSESLRSNGTTYLGDAGTDAIYINAKSIFLNGNTSPVLFTGLKNLWSDYPGTGS